MGISQSLRSAYRGRCACESCRWFTNAISYIFALSLKANSPYVVTSTRQRLGNYTVTRKRRRRTKREQKKRFPTRCKRGSRLTGRKSANRSLDERHSPHIFGACRHQHL